MTRALKSFEVCWLLNGQEKVGDLPAWLSDSLDEGYGGDVGLMQTTRLSVHQTKVRLLAAAVDAIEEIEGRQLDLSEVDRATVERGLLACVDRHETAWRDLLEDPPPSFSYAFSLFSPDPQEPGFMQCPIPLEASVIDEGSGLKLLPGYGFALPTSVPASGDAQLAFQLMAYAGKLNYVRGSPSSSRPLAQAVALDIPGRPSWRFRHEVETTLDLISVGREKLALTGGVVFAWMLPFLPNGLPLPRGHQHPCLLDIASPFRVLPNRRVRVFNRPCKIGKTAKSISSAAISPRDAWAATGLPCLPLAEGKGGARKGKPKGTSTSSGLLEAAGLAPKPDLIQKPFSKVPSSADVLRLIETARFGGAGGDIGVPALGVYRRESPTSFAGVELVIEGEPIGRSTTRLWIEVRVPLPDPASGAESIVDAWTAWQQAVGGQIEARRKAMDRLKGAAIAAWLARRQGATKVHSKTALSKASEFAWRWVQQAEEATEASLWEVAARTWSDKAQNEALWNSTLRDAVRSAAAAAFDALGSFDDGAAVLAASGRFGLLSIIHGRQGVE